jgi:hypothetical protein
MNDPYWTLWATPTRRTKTSPLDELSRLEYPREDPHWLLASLPVLPGRSGPRRVLRRSAKSLPDHEATPERTAHRTETGPGEHPGGAVA